MLAFKDDFIIGSTSFQLMVISLNLCHRKLFRLKTFFAQKICLCKSFFSRAQKSCRKCASHIHVYGGIGNLPELEASSSVLNIFLLEVTILNELILFYIIYLIRLKNCLICINASNEINSVLCFAIKEMFLHNNSNT